MGTAIGIVNSHGSDSGRPGAMTPKHLARLRKYLAKHSPSTKYELVSITAGRAGPLIAADGRPILALTTIDGRAATSKAKLIRAVKTGEVRYATLGSGGCKTYRVGRAACLPAAIWAKAHAVEVTHKAGQGTNFRLYRLTP
jgi:hypothetical protein